MSGDILDTLMKNSSSPFTRALDNSFVTDNTEINFPTDIPMLNVAFSGKMDAGFQSGITIWAGPSKHFKSMYALKMLDTWFSHNPDGVCMFFDSEYGITEDYIHQYPNINMKRVLHTPVTTIEELRHEATLQVENLYETYKESYKKAPKSTERPKVFILVDSVGQLASNKETEDAKDGKTTVDMTRAKAIKSFFRILTSKVKMLGIPMAVVAHTYDTLEMFSKAVVSGGTGLMYSADTVFIIGKSQSKGVTSETAKDLLGYNFTIRAEKSRFIKEGSKIPITVHYEEGILPYSGLIDIAKEMGLIESTRVNKKGGFKLVLDDPESLGVTEDITTLTTTVGSDKAFWDQVFKYTNLREVVEALYKIPTSLSSDEEDLIASVDSNVADLINGSV